jgi:hypothetical protein
MSLRMQTLDKLKALLTVLHSNWKAARRTKKKQIIEEKDGQFV